MQCDRYQVRQVQVLNQWRPKDNMGSICLEILKMELFDNCMAVKSSCCLRYFLKNGTKRILYEIRQIKTVNYLTFIFFTKKSDNQLIYDLTYIILNVNKYTIQPSAAALKHVTVEKNNYLNIFSFLHNAHLCLSHEILSWFQSST